MTTSSSKTRTSFLLVLDKTDPPGEILIALEPNSRSFVIMADAGSCDLFLFLYLLFLRAASLIFYWSGSGSTKLASALIMFC